MCYFLWGLRLVSGPSQTGSLGSWGVRCCLVCCGVACGRVRRADEPPVVGQHLAVPVVRHVLVLHLLPLIPSNEVAAHRPGVRYLAQLLLVGDLVQAGKCGGTPAPASCRRPSARPQGTSTTAAWSGAPWPGRGSGT